MYQQRLNVEGETDTILNFVKRADSSSSYVLFAFRFQREKCKESASNQKLEYLWANKGVVATVLISAVLILTVVVAMLATKETDGHSHSVHNANHTVHVHNVTEML